MRRLMREHRQFLIIVTALTLVMTLPTILYVPRTDVFWLPGIGDRDALTEIWDVWYGSLFLSGQADRFFTDRIFYPTGVSLVYHPFDIPYIIAVAGLQSFMPASNAFSLAYLLIIYTSTAAAYVYLGWLFENKWIAVFGAVIFGFSPHVIGHSYHPNNALVATLPLLVYCFHRGIAQNRRNMIIAAGLLTGLTSVINIYAYACAVLSLGLMASVLALLRWRSRRFWQLISILVVAIVLSSTWRIYPMMANSQSLDAALGWRGIGELKTDLISSFVNHEHPLLGPVAHGLLKSPPVAAGFSTTSYLGYVPLILIAIGLSTRAARPKMLPWLVLCAVFLLLRLGSHLSVNGVLHADIQLPKYYLDQVLPFVFRPFFEADNFQIGVILPLAVLSCYGLAALQDRRPIAAKPGFIILLTLVIASEYYVPVKGWMSSNQRFAFLDWLAQESADEEIRLINVPLGRNNSKMYNLFQALSGYPQVEGAISRTPDAAFDYIRANYLLNAWHRRRPIHCEMADQDAYLAGLAQLNTDGFSHVVYHRQMQNWADISDSFAIAEPSYSDDYVSIYRLSELRESCPEAPSARQRFTGVYAAALLQQSILDERPGPVVVIPPTADAGDHLLRYLRNFTDSDRTVLTITAADGQNIEMRNSDMPDVEALIDLEQYAALWLLNDQTEFDAEKTATYQDWFKQRFMPCAHNQLDERMTIALYLRADIPCSAVDESGELAVRYDGGVQLHNVSYVKQADIIRVYLAWANATPTHYAFSLQFFDATGNKVLQYDDVIYRQVLTAYDMDASSLPGGTYSIQLIVYDYETGASQGGVLTRTGERFERELEIGSIELFR